MKTEEKLRRKADELSQLIYNYYGDMPIEGNDSLTQIIDYNNQYRELKEEDSP